jgi:hypothetical protein
MAPEIEHELAGFYIRATDTPGGRDGDRRDMVVRRQVLI